jgi:methionyl aminopeptidase
LLVITLKTEEEIQRISRACEIVADVLDRIGDLIRSGVTTADLDAWAEEYIRSFEGARPAFKGLYGFPATLCTSINHEVVHGIPSPRRILREGDIVSIDVGVCYEGYYGDGAVTFCVGEVEPEVQRLLEVTRQALQAGVEAARPGAHVGDISAAIERVGMEAGCGVPRELTGHGIGSRPHEDPQVPNYGRPGQGVRLEPGLVLAIEPMFNLGTREIETLGDDWTVVTADGKVSAHFEHTVMIGADGPRVLTVVPSKTG